MSCPRSSPEYTTPLYNCGPSEKATDSNDNPAAEGTAGEGAAQMLFRKKSYTWLDESGESKDFCGDSRDYDAAEYDLEDLLSWHTFFHLDGSFLDQRSLWIMAARSLVVSIFAAIITMLTPAVTRARAFETAQLSTFLNVFIGMLLGFFISFTVQRWHGCAGAFMDLLDSVRNLQMQCFALGVTKERVDRLCRYGVLSARLVYKFHYHHHAATRPEDFRRQIWEELEADWPGLVHPEEKEQIKDSDSPYAVLWTWVASLIGRMAQDGEIPPMASPTYARMLTLVQNAYGSIRRITEYVNVQIPFMYAHTLACLVHINNMCNAVNFGVTLGFFMRVYFSPSRSSDSGVDEGKTVDSVAALVTAIFMSVLAPMLYHTLLTIGFCFAQPLSSYHTRLPMMRFMKALEKDLHESAILADNPPWWDKPLFKKA